MNADQRRICDGLAPDEDTPIGSRMDWLKEHCERLAWELEATTRELNKATAKLRSLTSN